MMIARRSLDNRCVNLLARRTATLSTRWKPHDYCFVQTGMNVFLFVCFFKWCYVQCNRTKLSSTKAVQYSYPLFPVSYHAICIMKLFNIYIPVLCVISIK